MATLEGSSESLILPALLQPADIFVELAGEEFRKRLFLTEGADGATLCLRPDFTIPVCLEHLRQGRDAPMAYAYRGKIFRKRRASGEPEFEQAGTEWIGHDDEMATDARLFALAFECAADVGLAPKVRVGDQNVFTALTEALGLSKTWRTRLTTAFGDEARLSGALDRLARKSGDGIAARLAPSLAKMNRDQARAVVDAIIGIPEHVPAGGRSSRDIAERILEQAASNGAHADAVAAMQRYFALSAPLDRAADTIAAFARTEGLVLDNAIARFAERADAMVAHGIDTGAIAFDAGFGRRIGYYTGFVFEISDAGSAGPEVIAGGRYDRLIALLDPAKSLPAIGFSVWLDRLPEKGAA
ncbi:ATP phosphoribosyltransferase regulatory subunit [Acuticoccus sp. M5D2P5]|uniref:ATP phosphoribosyltransferase regulatory subunit n=1 Tax=Acuticoccus kalidii TaxID=2910977 RepID=UPI001F48B06A|nr:ATP phosphoribosyltransferase regulatory subunit [Acuticoccus kalidii]MCF3932063.1 ATP phosphoribosyltransferase regulatory subunit [Acuticoccus kalidii]